MRLTVAALCMLGASVAAADAPPLVLEPLTTADGLPQATVMTDAELDTLWRPLTQHALRKQPLTIVEGHRCTVVDSEGEEYFDAIAGLWCVNVGYGRRLGHG